jgi:exoribonuclease R
VWRQTAGSHGLVLLRGAKALSRALDGDRVALRLLPEAQAEAQGETQGGEARALESAGGATATTGSSDPCAETAETAAAAADAAAAAASAAAASSAAAAAAAAAADESCWSTGAGREARPYGEVVGILQRAGREMVAVHGEIISPRLHLRDRSRLTSHLGEVD